MVRTLPWIAGEPDFRRVAEIYGVDVAVVSGLGTMEPPIERVALEGLRWLAATFVPEGAPLDDEAQIVRFVTRIHDTIEVFVRSFIPLRDGYRAFAAGMDLGRRGVERTGALAIEQGKSVQELTSALLDFEREEQGEHRAVEGMFADLMIHQVALLRGVMRGVKSLLGELAPGRVQADVEFRRARGRAGITVGPYLYRALWNAYQQRHADIDDGEGVAFGYVFGQEFARTYRRLVDEA